MTNASKTPIWVYAGIFLAAVFALISIFYRYRMEHRNKAVGLCLEMQAILDASATDHKPVPEILAEAKKHGLVAVALSEQSFPELIDMGEIEFVRPSVITGTPEALEQVSTGLEARFGPRSYELSGQNLTIHVPPDELATLMTGISPTDAAAVHDAGLLIIARHGNAPGANVDYIHSTLKRSKDLGATIYLPEGDQALGQKKLLEETALTLQELGMYYAAPEFVKISGDTTIAEKSQTNLIRLHSIQAAEADRMSPAEIEDRFVRAFRERNIRLLLLRPMTQATPSATASVYGVLDTIRGGIMKEGGKAGIPRPFIDTAVPKPLFLLIGLCAAVVGIWVGTSLIKNRILRVIGIVAVLGLAGACWTAPGRLYMATFAAMVFPIAAYIILEGQKRIGVIKDYIMLSLVSLTGGLCVAGLLNELPYFIRVDQFFAVKLAHFGPIAIIGWYLLCKRYDLKELFKSPVHWASAILGILILGALGFMLARTGNDNPAAVSDLELRFRSILDTVLYTRPRTKEFLIGDPAFLIGLFMMAIVRNRGADYELRPKQLKRIDGWAALMLTLGAIGQTSIVNTMCHAHTPVDLSLARIAMGLLIGGILGAILWAVLRGRLKPHPGEGP